MRMVITSPDGLGDAVLRLPLLGALRAAGHDVLLICREISRPLLERFASERAEVRGSVRVVELREHPYAGPVDRVAIFEAEVFEAVERFKPELLVFGAYQWTVFEEQLTWRLVDIPRVRMSGHRFARGPNRGSVLPSSEHERVVPVDAAWHESRKNQALCGTILGREVTLPDPVMAATTGDVERAQAWLQKAFAGQVPDRFWIGCVGNAGDHPGTVRDWGRANWAETLRFMTVEKGIPVVLVGSGAERPSLEAIREQTGNSDATPISTGDANTAQDLSLLIGLTALGAGYIGKDSGPMHIAAALGKPVVAVFGGGHWAQFTPLATPSVAVTVGLPCVRCAWVCHLPESWCIKRVPVAVVIESLAGILEGAIQTREVQVLAPSTQLVEATRVGWLGESRVSSAGDNERAAMTNAGPPASSEAMEGTQAALLTAVAGMRQELAALRQQMTPTTNAGGEEAAYLRQELKALTQAAVERERAWAAREAELNAKLLAASMQGHAAKFDAAQLSEKLASAESLNGGLNAQAVQIEGRLRQQVATLGGLEGTKEQLVQQLRTTEAAQQATASALATVTSERDGLRGEREELRSEREGLRAEVETLRAQVAELTGARSRKWLLKLGLVKRCHWEQ